MSSATASGLLAPQMKHFSFPCAVANSLPPNDPMEYTESCGSAAADGGALSRADASQSCAPSTVVELVLDAEVVVSYKILHHSHRYERAEPNGKYFGRSPTVSTL